MAAMDAEEMEMLKEAMDSMRLENAKLHRALQSSEDRVSTLQKQLAGRMMTDRNAIQQASGLAQIAAGRQEKLRVVLWISNRVTQEAAYSQARLCLWAWGRHALLQRHLEAAKPSKKEASPASPGSPKGTKGTKEVAAPSPAPSQVTDSGLALIHEAHLERCQLLAKWSAKRQSWLLAEQSAYRCLAAWRKFCFASARQRLAEWSAEQLERQVNHGLLVYCFFSFRRFVKGTRRPGTAVKDEEGATEIHREELSLLTPAALCRATFHESASRRLRLVTVWQAWRSATVDLRQERVAVALHSRFEQEHDLIDERIIFCRDAVVKEKLRGHQAFLLRWIFDAFMRSTVMGRHKARSLRKEQELQSMFDDAKRSMVQLSSAAVAILERMRRDPKPWTMKLILHLWVFSTELSKEQLQTEGVQRHLKDALAEVSLLHRRLAAAGQPAREEPNPALEEFEAAGRAALSIYGSAETPAVKNRPASSSSSAYVSTEGPRVRVPKGNDFASTMAYLREARKNPGVAVWDQHVAPSPVENAGKSIGTNSALWAQLDELDGYMAGMSGRFEGT